MALETAGKNLRAVLEETDAETFVGREVELGVVANLLDPHTPSRLLTVHGPGGIGKSAFLRAAARLATAAGYDASLYDARTFQGGLDRLVDSLLNVTSPRTMIVLDEVDHLGSLLPPLRDALIDHLPAEARVVFGGRAEPDQSWHDHGLPGIVVDLPLGALDDTTARLFLAQRAVTDIGRVQAIVAWARGYPLALTVAASAPGGGVGAGLEVHLEERLTAWLAGRSMLDVDREVLEVAAIARVVDARLLAAALPGRSTRELLPRLQSLPVMQALGSGISMHPVLAESIKDRLKVTSPQRYRDLVRRIASHLATRARLGDMDALIELSQLIESPDYRSAIGNEPSRVVYADRPRADEFATFSRTHGFAGGIDATEIDLWRAGGTEFVLRHVQGDAALWVCLVPLAQLGSWGPIADSQRAVAERVDCASHTAFATIALFAEGDLGLREEVSRLASGAFMHHAAVPDLQVILMSFPEPSRRPGSNAIDTYEISDAGPRAVVVSDFRPLGATGFVEALVLTEQGFEPHAADTTDLLAPNDDPEREAKLRVVLGEVFGTSTEDRRLRAVLEARHLGPHRSEAALLAEFHVGRSTWYRMLRVARERVLAHSQRP